MKTVTVNIEENLFHNLYSVDVGRRTYTSKSSKSAPTTVPKKLHIRVPGLLLSEGEQGLGQADYRRLPKMP
ncbi:hypothetical protein LMG27174_02193 [Paraburkholderia rhynchosiae]|uniref:Uncharacterized protein n=1 Tax=Paraburkholderia rhynchosiae TaxID=487049 RepID=A0A6J5AMZ8_9BURK|nr:hypothetical protein LMG27174_02193 [Paraburkholderia rhynchosiae]